MLNFFGLTQFFSVNPPRGGEVALQLEREKNKGLAGPRVPSARMNGTPAGGEELGFRPLPLYIESEDNENENENENICEG